jgi:hypothetical protein
MNVGIGSEAAQFHFWEYLFPIFGTMSNGIGAEEFLDPSYCFFRRQMS